MPWSGHADMTTNLLDFDLQGLVAYCEQLGEKRFRATQLFRWIHQRGAKDFSQMTDLAKSLVKLAAMTRGLKDSGLPEGASTRLLIQTGKLIGRGIPVGVACRAAISEALSDDRELLAAMDEMISSLF